ncbi:MAG: 3TM-type holin [Cycloclasticus sp.]
MGFLSFFTGKGAGDVIGAAGNALDQIFTSDDERAQAKLLMEKLKQHPAELQIELNKIEAAHKSIFVSGWRPFIGWVAGLSLFCFYVPQFFMGAVVWVVAIYHGGWVIIPPYPVNDGSLMELVLAMLGMATLRTYDKKQGTTSNGR